MQCEELALNLYPKAVCQYIDRLIRRQVKPRHMSMIFQPARNMIFRYSHRRNDWIHMKGRMLNVYQRVGELVGDGFSERELDAIVFLADDCSDGEIDTAVTYARYRGIHSASYIKACIVGNRKRYMLSVIRSGKHSQYIGDRADIKHLLVGARIPRIDALRDIWKYRVRQSTEKLKIVEAELNARKNANKSHSADQGRDAP